MKGRKRRPTELHVVKGSYREDRHGPRPNPVPGGPLARKPAHVKGRAARIWKVRAPALRKLGLLHPEYTEMFAAWCCLAAEFEENPAGMNAARISQLRGLAASFGMTPSDRGRVSGPEKSGDPFEEFLSGSTPGA